MTKLNFNNGHGYFDTIFTSIYAGNAFLSSIVRD